MCGECRLRNPSLSVVRSRSVERTYLEKDKKKHNINQSINPHKRLSFFTVFLGTDGEGEILGR